MQARQIPARKTGGLKQAICDQRPLKRAGTTIQRCVKSSRAQPYEPQTNGPNPSAVSTNVVLSECSFVPDLAPSNKQASTDSSLEWQALYKHGNHSAMASMAGEYTDESPRCTLLIVVMPYNTVCISFFS